MFADTGGQLLCGIGFTGFAGFCLLLYVALRMWREERARKGAQMSAPTPDSPSALSSFLGRLTSSPPAAPAPAALSDAHEVLRVLRDKLTGRLLIEIGGKRYTKINEIQDPNVGQGFLTTLRDLGRFAGGLATGASPAPASPAEAAPRAATAPSPDARSAPPAAQAESSAPPGAGRSQAVSDTSAEPLRRPSMNPFKQMQVLREMEKSAPPPPKAITEQIDEILQEKMAGSSFTQRGLRVRAGASGGAAFELDGKAYDAVDDLPDDAARDLIRAAIKEWEKKQ